MAAVDDEILDEGGHPDDLDAAPAGEDGAAGGPEVFGYDTLRELQAALRVPDADGATSTSGCRNTRRAAPVPVQSPRSMWTPFTTTPSEDVAPDVRPLA